MQLFASAQQRYSSNRPGRRRGGGGRRESASTGSVLHRGGNCETHTPRLPPRCLFLDPLCPTPPPTTHTHTHTHTHTTTPRSTFLPITAAKEKEIEDSASAFSTIARRRSRSPPARLTARELFQPRPSTAAGLPATPDAGWRASLNFNPNSAVARWGRERTPSWNRARETD